MSIEHAVQPRFMLRTGPWTIRIALAAATVLASHSPRSRPTLVAINGTVPARRDAQKNRLL
jgi:hypothetical protein